MAIELPPATPEEDEAWHANQESSKTPGTQDKGGYPLSGAWDELGPAVEAYRSIRSGLEVQLKALRRFADIGTRLSGLDGRGLEEEGRNVVVELQRDLSGLSTDAARSAALGPGLGLVSDRLLGIHAEAVRSEVRAGREIFESIVQTGETLINQGAPRTAVGATVEGARKTLQEAGTWWDSDPRPGADAKWRLAYAEGRALVNADPVAAPGKLEEVEGLRADHVVELTGLAKTKVASQRLEGRMRLASDASQILVDVAAGRQGGEITKDRFDLVLGPFARVAWTVWQNRLAVARATAVIAGRTPEEIDSIRKGGKRNPLAFEIATRFDEAERQFDPATYVLTNVSGLSEAVERLAPGEAAGLVMATEMKLGISPQAARPYTNEQAAIIGQSWLSAQGEGELFQIIRQYYLSLPSHLRPAAAFQLAEIGVPVDIPRIGAALERGYVVRASDLMGARGASGSRTAKPRPAPSPAQAMVVPSPSMVTPIPSVPGVGDIRPLDGQYVVDFFLYLAEKYQDLNDRVTELSIEGAEYIGEHLGGDVDEALKKLGVSSVEEAIGLFLPMPSGLIGSANELSKQYADRYRPELNDDYQYGYTIENPEQVRSSPPLIPPVMEPETQGDFDPEEAREIQESLQKTPLPETVYIPPNLPGFELKNLLEDTFIEIFPIEDDLPQIIALEARGLYRTVRYTTEISDVVVECVVEVFGREPVLIKGGFAPDGTDRPEMDLPHPVTARLGSARPDASIFLPTEEEIIIHINTHDAYKSGRPNGREHDSALRIMQNEYRKHVLVLAPKLETGQVFDRAAAKVHICAIVQALHDDDFSNLRIERLPGGYFHVNERL